ncbi:mRNA N(3)-methylcytidine methyltransferase METTL8 [Clupea harengus]|uniref:tRNA N(3)-cytidine methyltransferase n=1 Tax=Clupea harengus TaxID=7950 RepID=A0A6P8GR21_CLUHA|nr:mRNA N(3)-methylcytidine methyltransferase METTL8 [Clupea harengus]
MQRLCRVSLAALARGGGGCCRSPRRLSSADRRPPVPLGGRVLTNPDCVFQHNMWYAMATHTEEERENARQRAEENSSERIPQEERAKYERDASQFWDGFYETHQNKFFKDRRWLIQEFPELLPPGLDSASASAAAAAEEALGAVSLAAGAHSEPGEGRRQEGSAAQSVLGGGREEIQDVSCAAQKQEVQPEKEEVQLEKRAMLPGNQERRPGAGDSCGFPGDRASFRILEVGCGAGNSVFPIISAIRGRGGFLYCCDFSSRAVQLVKDHPDYDGSLCHAFVQDVCDETASFPFPPHSLDVILLVFVLCAIQPHRIQGVVDRLASYLKPGGVVLFRDYGRYDLSQLRFKKGQCLSENFYSRRDGTCVYFFTKEEVHDLFTTAGLEEVQNLEDRRLQVNRAKKVVMRRVWMQSKFQKPLQPPRAS